VGVRGVLVYCADYRCGHSVALSADLWPDDARLSDIEPRFTSTACSDFVCNVEREGPKFVGTGLARYLTYYLIRVF
jgi:hypothetical protein